MRQPSQWIDRSILLDLDSYFREHDVDLFSEVSVEDIPEEILSPVLRFLPSARSVIVFGKEVPAEVYRMPARQKTGEMLKIAESLDQTAVQLATLFNAGNVKARPVPMFLPVRIVGDRVHGIVRLKQVAAAGGLGSIGKNTLLITPQFGPRVLLAGVVTDRPARKTGRCEREDIPLCTGCMSCVRVCPTKALGPDGVDAFRCRDVSEWVPPFLVPAVKWLLRREELLRCVAPLAPWVGKAASISCSLCVTECPLFEKR